MQVPAWYKSKSSGYNDCAEVQDDHFLAMGLHIALADGHVGGRYTVDRQQAEAVDPAEVIKDPGPNLGLHEQSYRGREKHQDHVGLAECFVEGRSLLDEQ